MSDYGVIFGTKREFVITVVRWERFSEGKFLSTFRSKYPDDYSLVIKVKDYYDSKEDPRVLDLDKCDFPEGFSLTIKASSLKIRSSGKDNLYELNLKPCSGKASWDLDEFKSDSLEELSIHGHCRSILTRENLPLFTMGEFHKDAEVTLKDIAMQIIVTDETTKVYSTGLCVVPH